MKRVLAVLLVAALLLAIAVAALAPASLVAPYVERASHGRVALAGVEGTLWRGKGIVSAGDSRLPVAWTLEPLPLLTGEAQLHLSPPEGAAGSPRAELRISRGRLAVASADVVVPAAMVEQAATRNLPVRGGWKSEGQIAVATPQLEWTPAGYRGELTVVWRNARLTFPSSAPVELGNATIALHAEGNRLAGPVSNAGGNLDVRGTLALAPDGGTTIDLALTPRRADDAELVRMLSAIGTPDGASWRIHWQTRPK